MSERVPDGSADRCRLCGRQPGDQPRGEFCSPGCRDAHAVYGDPPEDPPDGDATGPGSSAGVGGTVDDGLERTVLRVDGAARPVDEAYLESVVGGLDGVADCEASHVTETLSVEHDPELAPERIRDAASPLGYTAYLRDATDDEGGPTRRAREMAGDRRRSTLDMVSTRYVVGVVFGSFLLLPYVALLYPGYLARLLGGGIFASFGALGGETAVLLPVFAIPAGIVLVFTGLDVLRGGYVSLLLRRPTTDLLVSITVLTAYGYSVLALAVGRGRVFFDLTVVVAALVAGLAVYETTVRRRAMDRLTDLTVSQVDTARRLDPDGPTEVDVDALEPGDELLVRAGERVPTDGTLLEGPCTVDEAVVTGESLPVVRRAGDSLVGGSVVTGDGARLAVEDGATSTLDRITATLWRVQSTEGGIRRRADRLASLALPAVAVAALLTGGWTLAAGDAPTSAALAGLLAVVATCPWALGLATPLSVVASLEAALDRDVVVSDDTVFERLRGVDVVVFDKTGTLTAGEMTVQSADAPPDLLSAAGALERRGSHPAAVAIADAFVPDDSGTLAVDSVTTEARGIAGSVDGERVLVGHPDLFEREDWSLPEDLRERVQRVRARGELPVAVGRDGRAAGLVVLGDSPRTGWEDTLAAVGERADVVVLTGDHERAAERFGSHPAVDHVFAGVPPAGKTAVVRSIGADRRVAMVGDGTNDAPALGAADLGVALGSGTALAADAAAVTLAADDLSAVTTAFDLASAAGRRVRTNAVLALSYNAVCVPALVAGVLNPLVAMTGLVVTVGLLAGNSFRRFRVD